MRLDGLRVYAPETLRLHAAAMAEGVRVLRAVGATEAWADPMAQQHILGGTATGTDPARSVANAFGQAHDRENLFLRARACSRPRAP